MTGQTFGSSQYGVEGNLCGKKDIVVKWDDIAS